MTPGVVIFKAPSAPVEPLRECLGLAHAVSAETEPKASKSGVMRLMRRKRLNDMLFSFRRLSWFTGLRAKNGMVVYICQRDNQYGRRSVCRARCANRAGRAEGHFQPVGIAVAVGIGIEGIGSE